MVPLPDHSAAELVATLTRQGSWLAVAESCTGGLLAAAITGVAGASACFFGGVVSYANDAKARWLGVDPALIAAHGAVSGEVAEAMVAGLLATTPAALAGAITGIAGPGGGSREKPVGLVYIAIGDGRGVEVHRCHFAGDRGAVRGATVCHALALLRERATGGGR
ncbi:MAG: damage-inducible protein CinA [Nitrospirae bacterium CG18_big_fil_WC_8_21_14_2_50_70_55]|nr:nicotinamide-nucleotide amidohydrolase family protein [Deltaproteobacteria bacterium]PIQ03247.1 MAG: damage-inducible protein CinA [Nitrospirae bacterium CG18_big_fil_WC_8_21_14_2_50_70_55]PIU77486.1 MAG: damage-inducible protein CinA [Nitrospirae bacterium CG06_land_8_20_14_3_00_70_43]PIW83070.1 MAG: damage-inducible protein CinA [Nitrospirae bacterium CG_4_8_14_3_um_filter_70_85]PIX83269.1 MAG: damage-inducible protein CinA [Nitrospirae bacterium CG_4_10_14_3_um_filter_70_108]PJB96037.1 M